MHLIFMAGQTAKYTSVDNHTQTIQYLHKVYIYENEMFGTTGVRSRRRVHCCDVYIFKDIG
jgi:hypothetical protein